MQYQINIDIDVAGLIAIYNSGQKVTLVKSVKSLIPNPPGTGNLPIAWLAFSPLESNQITWVENYHMYATTTVLQPGATIQMTSQTPAPVQTGWTYTFAHGQFGSTPGSGSTYNLNNQQAGNFAFGLAQAAMINNVSTSAPTDAVPVLFNEHASFTPEENISIFLSSASNNGSVLTQVASNALTVRLTSQAPTVTVGFDDATNTFFLEGGTIQSPAQFAKRVGSSRVFGRNGHGQSLPR